LVVKVIKWQRLTGGLAQAGQWLARKFVRLWKFITRPSVSESPACRQAAGTLCVMRADSDIKYEND